MTDPDTRRPLNSRSTGWANALSRRLAASRITPNQISQGSILFALIACAAFWTSAPAGPGLTAALLFIAALTIQLRLLCNLLDGMVAVEGGKGSPDGAFWNEAPDRLADLLILGGVGLAIGLPWLGLLAAALAIFTAYLRELGRAEGLPPDFCGPMAKPHRMAGLTGGAVLGAFETLWLGTTWSLLAALVLVTLGTIATILRRARNLIVALR